jgi:hypothetical protein
MPDTTYAATRVELLLPETSEYSTKSVAPAATRAFVRRPAIRARHCPRDADQGAAAEPDGQAGDEVARRAVDAAKIGGSPRNRRS